MTGLISVHVEQVNAGDHHLYCVEGEVEWTWTHGTKAVKRTTDWTINTDEQNIDNEQLNTFFSACRCIVGRVLGRCAVGLVCYTYKRHVRLMKSCDS